MKTKVCIVIDSLGSGGAQRQIVEYLKRADNDNFEIILVNLDKDYNTLASEIDGSKYKIVGIQHSGFLNISTLLELIKLFKKEKPDIVHTYLFTADCYGRLAAKMAGVKAIICATRAVDIWKKWHHILVDRILASFTDAMTINAEGIKPYLVEVEKMDPRKIVTIYNGVDLDRFKNLKEPARMKSELGIPENALIVGMVSRFNEQKDYETFFKTAEEIAKDNSNVYFIGVGNGPTLKSFENRYPLHNPYSIIFTGSRKDVPDIINAMDVCVLASHYEGCPNVILEYMACSKPVIASNVGGCAELVADGKNGFIVPESDPKALLDKISYFLDKGSGFKRRLEMGREGRSIVEASFTSAVMAKNTEKLYDNLLKPKTAFIFSQFPSYDETFILREMDYLKAHGLNFTIYSIKRCNDKIIQPMAKGLVGMTQYLPIFSMNILFINMFTFVRHPARYISTFFHVFIGNIKSPNFFIKNVGLWPQSVAFADMAKKDRITHVHGQWATFPATYAFVISRLNNIPFSFTGHAHDIYMDTTMLADKIHAAEFVVTCTYDNKRYLRNIEPGNIIVNHHGVNPDRFDVRAGDLCGEPFHVLSVGTLSENKGFDIVIDACKILQDKNINFKCTIAGGGPLEKSLRAQAVSLGLENKIAFTGYIAHDKLIPYYLSADVFTLSARLDKHWGIPNVFIEALASRVPVIATALPSIPELVDDGKSGFIIPEKDPNALADKFILLANDPALRARMGEAGRAVVLERFDANKNAAKFMEFFTRPKPKKMKRRMLRSVLSTFFYFCGLFRRRAGIIALMYHRVNDELEPNDLVVGTRTFARQMEYLRKNDYSVISAEEMVMKLKDPDFKAGKKEVVITFDDGYRDNFLNAYPILKECGFPATIFLTAGMTGTDKKRPRYNHLSSPDMLTWEDVQTMSANGISFGAHTMDHPHLDSLDIKEMRQEIVVSRETIARHLHPAPTAFCYPYGDYNSEVKNVVRSAGFECAFTTYPGINAPGCDLFELNRTEMSGVDTLFDFKKKLEGGYDVMHSMSESKRRRNKQHIASNPAQINVLYVIWSLGLGGAEQVVINLARNLDKTQFKPIICCLNDKGKFAEELENEGIKVVALGKKGKVDLSIIGKLVKVIKENRIDVVNTHLWGANFWGRIAARIAGAKVVIATEHNTDTWKSKWHFILDNMLGRWTDALIAVSNSVKEFYVKEAGLDTDKVKVIHNGVSIGTPGDNAQVLREEFGIKDDETVLALIGRLVPQKGHRYFMSALKDLSRESKVKGLIIGSGPMEEELKKCAKNEGLDSNLIFTGLRKDVSDIFSVIDILVMPSLREGLPIVALEAMARNKPVVATSVGGNPEVIIDGQTGLLVPPDDLPALKVAIKRLIDDKQYAIKLGEGGNNRLKAHFSTDKMVRETEALYRECLNRKRVS